MFALEKKRVPKFLLVDDDPVFGKLMSTIAKKEKIDLIYVQSTKAAAELSQTHKFDVAILDYDLGDFTGSNLAAYFNTHSLTAPVVLVSQNGRIEKKYWAGKTVDSIGKTEGAYKIIVSALRAFDSQ